MSADPTVVEPWWRGAVIYQIYPRSFVDANADGVGDLPGITQQLPYVASLGVDAIWLSPFFRSPMRDFGYDISDYCDVDPIFGTLADFEQLVARAHGLGLKVVIDQVYSHSSDLHPWFVQSRQQRQGPKSDWYVWADPKPDGSPPNNWQSVFGGPAWAWEPRRRQYYLHNFLASQPDLNLHNPEVLGALLDVTRFWLQRGVDGLRLDAINYAYHDPQLRDNPAAAPASADSRPRTRPVDFQQGIYNKSRPQLATLIERVRSVCDQFSSPGNERFCVAEIGGEDGAADMRFVTQGDARLQTAYGFDFLLANRPSADLVRRVLKAWPATEGGWPSWALSNHDAPRVVSRWTRDRLEHVPMARLCLLLATSLRGNLFLYQGEELGLPQADVPYEHLQDPEAIANWPETLGRDGARTPMPWRHGVDHGGFTAGKPWLPVSPEHLPLAVDRQQTDPASCLTLTRQLLALRRRSAALRWGDVTFLEQAADANAGEVLQFVRQYGRQRMLCAFNFGVEAAPVRWPGDASQWQEQAAVNGATLSSPLLPPLSGLLASDGPLG